MGWNELQVIIIDLVECLQRGKWLAWVPVRLALKLLAEWLYNNYDTAYLRCMQYYQNCKYFVSWKLRSEAARGVSG